MSDFNYAFDRLMPWEGINVTTNDPNDPGGITTSGVIEAEARQFGYNGKMEKLPLDFAKQIHKRKSWDTLNLDYIDDTLIATQIFQASVNQGSERWAFYIQQICNSFLPESQRLTEDGHVGNLTILALNELSKTDRMDLSKKIYTRQLYRYAEIVYNDIRRLVFWTGWNNRAKEFLVPLNASGGQK